MSFQWIKVNSDDFFFISRLIYSQFVHENDKLESSFI